MSDKMDLAKIVHKIVEETVQDMAYKISDLCEKYDSESTVFFLVAEQLHIRALLPLLSEKDRKVFNHLVEHGETAVLPMTMDPRKGRE